MSSTATDAKPPADAAQAMQLFMAGAIDEALPLYRRALSAAPGLLSSLHLRGLEQQNRIAAADALRVLILTQGHDLNAASQLHRSRNEIVNEYRDHFARGHANAAMLMNYSLTLSQLGSKTDATALLDCDCLLAERDVGPFDPAFWRGIAERLAARRTPENWEESRRSVRKMHNIRGLEAMDDPPLQMVLGLIHEHAEAYVTRARSDAALPWIPHRYRLSTWAVISAGDGFNVPHIHHKGWASGVLYLAGPTDVRNGHPAGALRIGSPQGMTDNTGWWPDRSFAPAPGHMVIMPSWFTHWTLAIGRPYLRVAIAFDIIDARDGDG